MPSRLTHLKFKFYLQDWNLFQCVIMIQTFKMLKHCGRVCSPYNLRIDWVPSAPLIPFSLKVLIATFLIRKAGFEAKKVGGMRESTSNSTCSRQCHRARNTCCCLIYGARFLQPQCQLERDRAPCQGWALMQDSAPWGGLRGGVGGRVLRLG